MEDRYTIKFDPRTIEHLGIKMYSTLPPVLAELIANAYDADAEKVVIDFDDSSKSITITDDGHGMTQEELNDNYLVIGRNRRAGNNGKSPRKGRRVTGRKGIGKLAMFGIASVMETTSIKDGRKNGLSINYADMLKEKEGEYHPESLSDNEISESSEGTCIILSNIKRKTDFDIESIAANLALRLDFFREDDFRLELKTTKGGNIIIDKEYKKKKYPYQFEWQLEELFDNSRNSEDDGFKNFMRDNKITGYIASPTTPNQKNAGIALFARGKIINDGSFYDLPTSNSHAYSYLTGEIRVDYIDDDEDYINTQRNSLVWTHSATMELREFLQHIIKLAVKQWNERRRQENKKEVAQHLDTELDVWLKNYLNMRENLLKTLQILFLRTTH